MNMSACTLFNEQNEGPNLLIISTWSVLGKQNVQAKKVYSNTFVKTYRKFMIRIYKLTRGNLDTIFDLNSL